MTNATVLSRIASLVSARRSSARCERAMSLAAYCLPAGAALNVLLAALEARANDLSAQYL